MEKLPESFYRINRRGPEFIPAIFLPAHRRMRHRSFMVWINLFIVGEAVALCAT